MADLICTDGIISSIEETSTVSVDVEIDARGLLVFPGFIDPHVHSRDPGLTYKEDFAHSTRAAAAGGITTIIEMPNAVPPVLDTVVLEERATQHGKVAFVDFALWGMSLGANNLHDLAPMIAAGAAGVKLFWAYALNRETKQLVYNLADLPPDAIVPPPSLGEVLDVFREMARCGGLLAAHCEDRDVVASAERALGRPVAAYEDLLAARPGMAENASVALAVEFARATGCRFHVVHMASARSVEIVRRAQLDEIRISAETCPQYLTLTDADCASVGSSIKVFPPIQSDVDQMALWRGVVDGVIGSIGSDHAPHTIEEKQAPLDKQPAGVVGVETIASVMTSEMGRGRISAERLASVMSEGTSRLYGMYPQKGAILPGSDADFTIVDPSGELRIDNAHLHSKHPLSPWHGRTLRCVPRMAVLRGQLVMQDSEPIGDARGKFVRVRNASGGPTQR